MSDGSVQGQRSGVKGQGYQQLLAWQRAHQLALAVYRSTNSLSSRDGWLRSQIVRAAVSVPANVAEGYSRDSLKEYLHFLSIARGSLAEVEYYVLFIRDAGLLPEETGEKLDALRRESGRLLLGLMRSLREADAKQARGPRQVGEEHVDYILQDLSIEPLTRDP